MVVYSLRPFIPVRAQPTGSVLKLNGVGFKGFIWSNNLVFQLGYSHYLAYRSNSGAVIRIKKQKIALSCIGGNLKNQLLLLRRGDSYKARGVQDLSVVPTLKEGKRR